MKLHIFFAAMLLSLSLVECSSSPEEAKIEQYANKLITQYPNHRSNEFAAKSLNDSIAVFCDSFVGKEATIFSDVKFKFAELIENPENGSLHAIFEGENLSTQIESNANGAKYIIADIALYVIGEVSKDNSSLKMN